MSRQMRIGARDGSSETGRAYVRRWQSLTMVVSMLLGISACTPIPPRPADGPLSDAALYPTFVQNPRPTLEPYLLQVGDDLAIKFYTNPELNEEVKIRPDGMISLQLIDDVLAAGLSPKQLDAELTKRYTGELADPQISVIVKLTGGQRVYVAGEVGKQGVLPLVGGMTLYQALQDAGGFTETAHRKQVVLIRKGPDGTPFGKIVDVRPVEDGYNPALDIPLRPLDIVFVPRSKIANVDLFVKQYIRDALPISTLPIPAF